MSCTEAVISVIVPARNEADGIERCLARVVAVPAVEVVVIDGCSVDDTASRAEAMGARVLRCEPGRSHQLNVGAVATSAEKLLFLHADTLLPPGWSAHVQQILNRPGVAVGAFRLGIDVPRRRYRGVEALVNMRSRVRSLPYGDQALFMRREVFDALGGFPCQPLLEDYEFMRRAKRLGDVQLAPARVRTSGRRWEQWGIVRTTWVHQVVIASYRLGIPPSRIAQWYKRRGRRRD